MNKFVKWLSGCLIAGISIGLSICAFKKYVANKHVDEDVLEEDDFDLDKDLQPVKEREYVSLQRDETV